MKDQGQDGCFPFSILILALAYVWLGALLIKYKLFDPPMTTSEFAHWMSTNTRNEKVDLFEAIALRKWNVVYCWLAFSPDRLAKLRDGENRSALHHACLFRAPSDIIEFLLDVAPELASVQNRDGETALHWAVRLSMPFTIIQAFIEADPESPFAQDEWGASPVSLLWDRHQSELMQAYREDPSRPETVLSKPALQKISTMLCATAQGGIGCPLFELARRPSPPGLFPFFLKLHRSQLFQLDDNGHSLLAICCQNEPANRSTDILTKIQLVLAEAPALAVWRDAATDRLPIHFALENGIRWQDGLYDLIECTLTVHETSIWSCGDPVTKLFPSLLAASLSQPANSRSADLSTIYQLLRCDPAVVTSREIKI